MQKPITFLGGIKVGVKNLDRYGATAKNGMHSSIDATKSAAPQGSNDTVIADTSVNIAFPIHFNTNFLTQTTYK
ncbi:MAG TPA: hypothetical protein VKR83_11250 [Ktedonobacteraceae bacterium]|nr:hypothetical protein [Ktedonobacteraceae bacterium]